MRPYDVSKCTGKKKKRQSITAEYYQKYNLCIE
jgi:hypothetical protein